MTWLPSNVRAPSLPARASSTLAESAPPAYVAAVLQPSQHYLLERTDEPVPDAAFAQAAAPERAAPLSAREYRYLCFSIDEGVGRYIDLLSASYRNGTEALPQFAKRFATLYTEGRKARFFANENLDKTLADEDDTLADDGPEASAHPGWWWNAWPGSAEMRQTAQDLRAFGQRIRAADDFFAQLGKTRRYLLRSIGAKAPAAEKAAAQTYIDEQLATHIDRARSALAQGIVAMQHYPDHHELQRKVDAFRASFRGAATAPARRVETTTSVSAEIAAVNRAIVDINQFYADNTTHVMGAPHTGKTANMPALELLGVHGVVTYLGPNALADALKYGPRAHLPTRPGMPMRWKYGPLMMVNADRFDRIPIRHLRLESSSKRSRVPYARYVDIELRADRYKVGSGPWQKNPHPENEDLEKAKYLTLSALIRKAKGRHALIQATDDPQDPRDYTGFGWIQRLMKSFGFSRSRGEEHGQG